MTAIAVRRWALMLVVQSCALGCAANIGYEGEEDVEAAESAVTFGDIDWKEYGDLAAVSQERRWADATGFLTNVTKFQCIPGDDYCTYTWSSDIEDYNGGTSDAPLCAAEVGADQPIMGASCTAFLVGPQLFATAGHCFSDAVVANCTNVRVAFGITVSNGQPEYTVDPSQIYKCTTVVKRGGTTTNDYALFKVDRPVSGRIPLWVRRYGAPSVGQGVSAIGYPFGLPMKIDLSGKVKGVQPSTGTPLTITENCDTEIGTSGGPVLNSTTGVVEAVHVQAPPNTSSTIFFVQNPDTANECLYWFPCNDNTGCPGFNSATLTSTFSQYVPLHPAGIMAVL